MNQPAKPVWRTHMGREVLHLWRFHHFNREYGWSACGLMLHRNWLLQKPSENRKCKNCLRALENEREKEHAGD